MTSTDLILNFAIGTGSGIIASVLTLIGDRWLQRVTINRHVRRIAGHYTIIPIAPQRDTSAERVVIQHVGGCRFSIAATGGPTGDWKGDFVVRDDFLDIAHGIYCYPDATDWGQHELLFDTSSDSIFAYGVNRSKPGLMEPFSFRLVRYQSNATNVA